MRYTVFTLLFLYAFACTAQNTDSLARVAFHQKFAPYEKHSISLTMSVGFIDQFRSEIKLPKNFENNNVSGFAPISIRGEYGLTKNISVAAAFSYNTFYDNYDQLFYGNGETFRRYNTDAVRIYSGAAMGYYHFGKLIHSKNLDVFAGLGLVLNNIRHNSAPQTDSTSIIIVSHTATLYLKAGIRYYLTDCTSLYADAGYDHQSMVNVGFSYRFRKRGSVQ